MVTLTYCVRRLPHLTAAEFQRYWRQRHALLVQELAPVLRLKRYAQLHTLPHQVNAMLRQGRGGPEEYDGIAVLTWDSIDDLIGASATQAGREAGRRLVEDERRFIDLARSPLWVNEEHVIIEPKPADTETSGAN